MRFIRNLNIRFLLPLLFALVTAIAIAQGLVALLSLSMLKEQIDLVGRDRMPRVQLISKLDHTITTIRRNYADLLLASSQDEIRGGEESLKKQIVTRGELMELYGSQFVSTGTSIQFDAVKTALAAFDRAGDALITQVRGNEANTAMATYRGPMRDAARAVTSALDTMTARNYEIADAAVGTSDQVYSQSQLELGVAIVTGVVLALVAAFVSYVRIAKPITRITAAMSLLANGENGRQIPYVDRRDEIGSMAAAVEIFRGNAIERLRLEDDAEANRGLSETERLARERQKAQEAAEIKAAVEGLSAGLSNLSDGDITYRLSSPFVGDLDVLRQDFNASMQKLQGTLLAVGENARMIDAGANEIRSAAEDLSRRTEQQAASVEETAAALEQVTTAVKDAALSADEAGRLVAGTRENAERSGTIVTSAVTAMQEIEKSSAEISNIIGVIDDIAFQTNLLALNAGVEAARAGEAGKGFAVVAQEVRELAQRSAHAAKEIKTLITTSSGQVRRGVSLVDETGRVLSAMLSEVGKIDGNVTAIVTTSREQSNGLSEINVAVNQIDQGTQQNAAMVEQTTAATHSLAKQAEALTALLSQFKLQEGNSAGLVQQNQTEVLGLERAKAGSLQRSGNNIAA